MPNILGLKDWKVLKREESTTDMKVECQYTPLPTACPRCGVENPTLYKHDVRQQEFMDTPHQGKRVHLIVQRQRFVCRECDKTFQQILPDMDESRNMTRRLLEYIQRLSLLQTFTEVADQVGVNEKTVRNIFNEHVDDLDAKRTITAPEWLGIDELQLLKEMRCMITDPKKRVVIDILPKRDKVSVAKWLSQLPDKERIQVVTIDMWVPYRDAANANLPHAQVVVDKFHVVRMANLCLDRVRKDLREGMDLKQRRQLMRDRHLILRRRKSLEPIDFMMMQTWTGALPDLFSAYQAKEDFYEIYDTAKDRVEAMELYDIWVGTLAPKTKKAFHDLIRACTNWRPEIFAFFDHRATNAYTEAANGMAKIINRTGRGYSFDAIRAKVLYGGKRRKTDSEYVTVKLNMKRTFKVLEVVRLPRMLSEKSRHEK